MDVSSPQRSAPHYRLQFHAQINEIDAGQWNALVRDHNPFLRHEFLHALEAHHCVSPRFGWIAHHLAVYEHDRLVAALPLYEKHNNYGEFVFDQAWSNAWERVGLAYYPKLVSAVPYSPVSGPRLLIAADRDTETLRHLILDQLQRFAKRYGFSGWHLLFAEPEQQRWFAAQPGFYTREDCHFHWFNRHYADFDDFLTQLNAKKRKNIRQERAYLQQQGVRFRLLDGHSATEDDWAQFNRFYHKTFTEKWSTPTLNQGFFSAVAQALPDQTLLVLADNAAGECIAGALMYHSDTVLYGRHWGATHTLKHLHFEACYYQGIEFAIARGLSRFEPGAGGEHKLARGFEPVITRSAHWLTANPFGEAIDAFCEAERQAVADYCADARSHSPFKQAFADALL